MAKPQTYENYYKAYFRSHRGKQALMSAKSRYHAKLRALYPNCGVNKAARMHKQSKLVPHA